MNEQCAYGTERSGSVTEERCPENADREYLGYGEDNPIPLCQEHFDQFHKSDFYSVMR